MFPSRPTMYVVLLLSCSYAVVAEYNSSPNPYLTSTTVFLRNYQKMVESFKVFMYKPDKTQQFKFETEAESMFYSSLQTSNYLTQHAEEAHLFFLPFSSDISTRSLGRLISRIRNDLPYWNRTLGADHFYLSCAGINYESDRNLVELKKNAIQISCFPTRHHRFVPHKDITLPPLLKPHAPPSERLCMMEHGNNVSWVGEALRLGCVPVMIVTAGPVNDMPFMDLLRWQEMAVFVRRSDMKRENDTWQEYKKGLGVVASKHFLWNHPPQPYDAFNTIMYQLWLRRHTVRYATVQ